jgi:hypothetical protein
MSLSKERETIDGMFNLARNGNKEPLLDLMDDLSGWLESHEQELEK